MASQSFWAGLETTGKIIDIDATNFWRLLPQVLEEIAGAEYVSFDLEMTGIRVKNGLSDRQDKFSVEEYYAAACEVAQTFQIIEFGSYGWTAYNFRLAPWYLGDNRTHLALAKFLDRRYTLSSNSFRFLRGNRGDDITSLALESGIMYLSRQEADEAYKYFIDPDKKVRNLIDLNKENLEANLFYDWVRSAITLWLQDPHKLEWLNIENPGGESLTNLQRRLVYQILESEFSHDCLRAVPKCKNDFMQITQKGINAAEETAILQRMIERKAAIREQTGFRFVFEALVGGDFADEIDIGLLLTPEEYHIKGSAADLRARLLAIEAKAKENSRVIVGHNSLFDLCFIYNSFIGTLPTSLQQFKIDIRAMFPRYVDTKYMATQDAKNIEFDQNLEELYCTVQSQKLPLFHPKAPMCRSSHQAGYDMLSTPRCPPDAPRRLAVKHPTPAPGFLSAVNSTAFTLPARQLDLLDLTTVRDGLCSVTGPFSLLDHQDGAKSLRPREGSLIDTDAVEIVNTLPLIPTRGSRSTDCSVDNKTVIDQEVSTDGHRIDGWNSPIFRLIGGRLRAAQGVIDPAS
ncbi:hypothetical protein MCOR02_009695 [Pyricularia oryzae]|uniref:Uncharacterized protein n=2 Tax=Pyricularia TaxID=48558 RepID=A0ABQ8P1N8_PYRGI|nr:hypothetical protein MCOR02_009695 [Pyricularia oryzae]KAI6304188.1 hypothetical protein MCOR33_000702 [Pyricularia grisea]KAI6323072.1 hypothetical protein MCOR34_001974 [Pyricularia oryzae]KAI6326217.1 hypothetical protein MCOR29_003473 [Pyricularia oryzae]KAI6347950.1 hypothetical protein MCOR28_001930 [Pyricularia oryzae]